MKKLIIFGNTVVAELAHFYFSRDGEYEIVAFTVDRDYKHSDSFKGLPNVAFEELDSEFNMNDHELFVAMGPNKMNDNRASKYAEAKAKGYKFASYISKNATVHSKLGENCLVADGAIINPFCEVGSNNFFWEHVLISNYAQIKEHSYFAPKSIISSYCVVDNNCVVGSNSVIKARIKLSQKTLIGATCYISKNTKENGVYGEKNSDFLGCISDKINISE